MNVSGIGFDGHIANRFGAEGARGWFTYTRLVFGEYYRYGTFEADITSNGEHFHPRDAFVIAIANSSQYGNNITIAPDASICDHRLHLTIFRKMPFYRLDLMHSFFNKTLKPSSFCQIMESDVISIKLPSPVDYHVDGEPCGRSDIFEISIQPDSLIMLVPKDMKGRI
jgi:diacylglycerol kinase (ATP)